MLEYAVKLTHRPGEMNAGDVEALRSAGFSDRDVLDICEVVAYYAEQTGRDVSGMDFFVTLGLFRLAGIVQQIYYRYHHNQTRNPAFRWFWIINHYLHHRAKAAMRGRW